MGHQRLGKLPASRKLPEIIGLLLDGNASCEALAEATAEFCDETLRRALKDPAFVEALWLLVRIPQAAKAADFREALRALGVKVPEKATATDIVAGFDAAVEAAQRSRGADVTDLGEIARQAGIGALYSLVQERLPALWEVSAEDTRTTVATLSGPEKFGDLGQRFFSGFVEHAIHYFLDRAIPTHVGPEKLIPSIGDWRLFDDAARRHSTEAAVIMRAFAKDWLAKYVIHGGKAVTRNDIARFGAYALEKIRKELSIRSKVSEEV